MSTDVDLDDLLDRAWRVARKIHPDDYKRARFRSSPDVRYELVRRIERYAIPPMTWLGEERLFGALYVTDPNLPEWTLRLEIDA